MNCVFCNAELPADHSCCDAALISHMSSVLRYHIDCDCEEARLLITGADARDLARESS